MKKDINEVLLVGKLVSVETKSTSQGTPLANIAVEVNRRVWDRETREFRNEPQQIPVIVWGADACYALAAVRIGQRLFVKGEVRHRQWTTADGGQRQRLEIFSTQLEPIVDVSIQSQQEIQQEISDFSDLTGLDKCQD